MSGIPSTTFRNQCAANHFGVNTRPQRATSAPRGRSIRNPAAESTACATRRPLVRDLVLSGEDGCVDAGEELVLVADVVAEASKVLVGDDSLDTSSSLDRFSVNEPASRCCSILVFGSGSGIVTPNAHMSDCVVLESLSISKESIWETLFGDCGGSGIMFRVDKGCADARG